MAAIDKLYVKSYFDYNELRIWAIAYYPELLFYFLNITLTYEQVEKNRKEWAKSYRKIILRDYERLGKFKTKEEAVQNLIKYYKDTADYDCSMEQAEGEVNYCIDLYSRLKDLKDTYTFPIMCTPIRIDKRLKWICPVSCVRKYLHEQCGVNPKWEWLYKIFWRGKKHIY